MSKYKIKISYRTGNSIESEDTIDYLELTWNILDVAKENLQRIKEHYLMYKEFDKWPKPTEKQIFDKNIKSAWFVNEPKLYKKLLGDGNWEYRPEHYLATYCLFLRTDDNTPMQMRAFWCGHFERLYSAEIEMDNSDMKIEF